MRANTFYYIIKDIPKRVDFKLYQGNRYKVVLFKNYNSVTNATIMRDS